MSKLNRQTMSELSDPYLECDETSEPLPHLQAMVRSVYSKMTQDESGGEAANVSPGCRREINELRRRFGSGVADLSRPSRERVRGDHGRQGAKDGPVAAKVSAKDAAKSLTLDEALDALRRASLEPLPESPAWRTWPVRSAARDGNIFGADRPTKFHSYQASFAVAPFAFIMMKTGRVDGGLAGPNFPRGNELVVASNRLPLQIVPETCWDAGRGNFWDMLRGWFSRLTAAGAYASFRHNLFGARFAPLALAARMRIGKISFKRGEPRHFIDMHAFLPRPNADAGAVSSADDSRS